MTEYKQADLDERYAALTASVKVWARFSTEMVGGQPASEDAIRAFAEHHLHIADPTEREAAVQRILKHEIEETAELGEVREEKVYGVNVLRRTTHGPWLGDWMIKAGLKQAASRVGLFQRQRGSKGNFSEAGRVTALDYSLQESEHPERVYLWDSSASGPAQTVFKEFQGRVQSPQGAKSITHHSEVIPAGTIFAFEFRFMVGEITESNILDVISMWQNCGVGSVRSMERGKTIADKVLVEKVPHAKAEKPPKKAAAA